MSLRFGAATLLYSSVITFRLAAQAAPAGAPAAPAQSPLLQMVPMILIMVVGIYFLVIMPASKQRKAQEALLSGMKVGDRVLLSSGIYGQIHKIDDETLQLRIAENVRIEINKTAVSKVLADDKKA